MEETQDQVAEEETAPSVVDNLEDLLSVEVCQEAKEDPQVVEDLQVMEGLQMTEGPQSGEIQERIFHEPLIVS